MDMDLQQGQELGDRGVLGAAEPSPRAETREWTLRPGQRKHSEAAFKLANWHFAARQVEKAIRWYERAAKAGHVRAQYNLGLIYLKGEDVAWDGLRGVEWLRAAAKNGDSKAQRLLRKIDPALSAE
ncbi:MAG: tetratricopeptide repeat protein [Acidiferrobacterales bacterium]